MARLRSQVIAPNKTLGQAEASRKAKSHPRSAAAWNAYERRFCEHLGVERYDPRIVMNGGGEHEELVRMSEGYMRVWTELRARYMSGRSISAE